MLARNMFGTGDVSDGAGQRSESGMVACSRWLACEVLNLNQSMEAALGTA
ncbi:hypothetical protein Cflav_PD0768 [Pedosphaera parvula Ellin514]|uniref:Uncharacterized protein n=2 Tax=Pedosphaera TaxID=1032526 RepID=B9XR10_PEDPL|nr:hypothetical protein Cflav_PD0768 [Pedosphaera parvula Ellin514]